LSWSHLCLEEALEERLEERLEEGWTSWRASALTQAAPGLLLLGLQVVHAGAENFPARSALAWHRAFFQAFEEPNEEVPSA